MGFNTKPRLVFHLLLVFTPPDIHFKCIPGRTHIIEGFAQVCMKTTVRANRSQGTRCLALKSFFTFFLSRISRVYPEI